MYQRNIFLTVLLGLSLIGLLSLNGCKKSDQALIEKEEKKNVSTAIATLADFSFENGTLNWKPLKASKISIEQVSAIKHGGNSSLKISGETAVGTWNYITSGKLNLEPGKKYKLSGWVYVESISSIKAPFLKLAVEQATKPPKFLTNFNSSRYDLNRKGTWQELSIEFMTPSESDIYGFIAIEKGTNTEAINAVIYIDDLKIEQI